MESKKLCLWRRCIGSAQTSLQNLDPKCWCCLPSGKPVKADKEAIKAHKLPNQRDYEVKYEHHQNIINQQNIPKDNIRQKKVMLFIWGDLEGIVYCAFKGNS